ncbi:SDR family oxidoreductase [soil metagenome]
MRCLILGAGGQIGAHVMAASQSKRHLVQGTWYCRPLSGGVAMDVRDHEAVRDVVSDFQPDVIYHLAGLSQIDYAETQPRECRDIALTGMANVIRAARSVDARIVMTSSDQVFGECKLSKREDDASEPMNIYGATQAETESLLRSEMPAEHLIVRTASVFGSHDLPRNPVLHALRRMHDGHCVTAARNRQTQPTYAPDLATAMVELASRNESGTVHIVGPDRMTEAAFLKQVAFINGCDSDLIASVPAEALCEDAPRPLTPWLDRMKMRTLLGPTAVRSLGEGLRAMRDQKQVAMRVAA